MPRHVLFYLDDGIIVGHVSFLTHFLGFFEEEAVKIGLQVNREKCCVWAQHPGTREHAGSVFGPLGIPLGGTDGYRILGVPQGIESFLKEDTRLLLKGQDDILGDLPFM